MRIAVIIARSLLGLAFFVFGLNGFLHFIPNPPPPAAVGAFFGALFATGYMLKLIFGTQPIGGALLLLGVAAPFALTILAPIIVNIIAFHIYLSPDPGATAPGLLFAALEGVLAWYYRAEFAPLLNPPGRRM